MSLYDDIDQYSTQQLLAIIASGRMPDGSAAAGGGYGSGPISITRPNNATPYTAGDVVGDTAAAITFPSMGPSSGGKILITSLTFERDAAAVIAGEAGYTLHLYNVTPPSALADNAVFDLPSGDRAAYLGPIAIPAPTDLGSTLYASLDGINKQVGLLSGNLYGYLVTVGAYTPVALAVHRIALHAIGV